MHSHQKKRRDGPASPLHRSPAHCGQQPVERADALGHSEDDLGGQLKSRGYAAPRTVRAALARSGNTTKPQVSCSSSPWATVAERFCGAIADAMLQKNRAPPANEQAW